MKLVSIISCWYDTLCLLPYAVDNHLKFCNGVIIIWSSKSNHGQPDNGKMLEFVATHNYDRVLFYQLEPVVKLTLLANETRKRNTGIEIAKREGYTHYFISDADELYNPEEVEIDKKSFEDNSLVGLVCGLRVYIKSPTLWTDDHTLIPFIHKLDKGTYVGSFPQYPFAYDINRTAQIDGSRRPNETIGIRKSKTICRHYSYVRSDIDLKINNSTANLKRIKDRIIRDITFAKPGYKSVLYHQELRECENEFNIQL